MAGLLRISALTNREFAATIQALRQMDKELSAQLRKHIKAISTSEWRQEVQANVETPLQQKVLANSANVSVLNSNIKLRAANSKRELSGGWSPSQLATAVEFGADRNKTKTYKAKSPKHNFYTVKNRHTARQLPAHNRQGRVVYKAARTIIPRIASLYVQTVLKTVAEAFPERK